MESENKNNWFCYYFLFSNQTEPQCLNSNKKYQLNMQNMKEEAAAMVNRIQLIEDSKRYVQAFMRNYSLRNDDVV